MAHFARCSLIFIALFLGAFCAYSMPAEECFDDEKLNAIQTQSQRGALVYVWSPRLVYSVQQMAVAARAAAANGLDFFVVSDWRVAEKELSTFKSSRLPEPYEFKINLDEQDLATPPFFPIANTSVPLCSTALLSNQALRHFPTAFIVTAQGVHRHPIIGAMPATAWLSSIAQRLQQP